MINSPIHFLIGVLIFVGAGIAFGFGALLVGKLVRPRNPSPLKREIYECGEPTIGPAWVQFDLRFYVVALLFVIFDVEIAMLYPWAVVYRDLIRNGWQQIISGLESAQNLGKGAFWEMMFFFSLIVLGFLYLWRFGYLDWVRSAGREQVENSAGKQGKKAEEITNQWR